MYRRILGWFIPPEYLDFKQQRKDIAAAIDGNRCLCCAVPLRPKYPDELCPRCFVDEFYEELYGHPELQDIPF